MNECISVTISGIPTAWAAPFFTGKRGISPRFREKAKAIWEIKQQYDAIPLEGPIYLKLWFNMPIPKSVSKKKRMELLMDAGKYRHVKRPDTTNLLKFAEDCIKGIIIKDDSQVVHIEARKQYDENPHTRITVFTI